MPLPYTVNINIYTLYRASDVKSDISSQQVSFAQRYLLAIDSFSLAMSLRGFFLADSLTHIPYNMSDVYRFIYAIGICNLLDLIQHTAHSINLCKKKILCAHKRIGQLVLTICSRIKN